MKQILEQGTGVLLCAALPAAGAVLRLAVFGYYTWLERACQRINETENRTIHRLKTEINHRKKNGIGVGTEDAYTVFYLNTCSFAGISIQTMERICSSSALLSLLVCAILSGAGAYLGCATERVIGMLLLGAACATGLLLMDLFLGAEEKKKRILFYFEDLVRNIQGKPEEDKKKDAERVLAFPLITEINRTGNAEKTTEMEDVRRETKTGVPAAKKEENGKRAEMTGKNRKEGRAQEEKRRLTEELLRERRQLSARQYIEETAASETAAFGKGTFGAEVLETEPGNIQKAREECAVTENDTDKYEKILRSVLAEFLS